MENILRAILYEALLEEPKRVAFFIRLKGEHRSSWRGVERGGGGGMAATRGCGLIPLQQGSSVVLYGMLEINGTTKLGARRDPGIILCCPIFNSISSFQH